MKKESAKTASSQTEA